MCNKVIRKHLGAIHLDTGKGEKIRHTVTLNQGASGLFSIADNASHSAILTSQPPGSIGPWTRDWPQAGDPVNGDTLQTILLQFLVAKSYTWRIDHLDANGHVLDTPLDVDYTGAGTDNCFDGILVAVKKAGGAN